MKKNLESSKGKKFFIILGIVLVAVIALLLISEIATKKALLSNKKVDADLLTETDRQNINDFANQIKNYYQQKYQK